jgi:inorganic phosphate transporter, PiT family
MTSWALLIIGATIFVAYANGANDNFKGVATLFGSGVADYSTALWWATATTAAGSLAAFFLAASLIAVFQGKGLVPAALLQSPPFLTAVIFGTAVTVFAATKIGMPISTTHGLTGAWVGGGIAAAGINLGFSRYLIDSTYSYSLWWSARRVFAANHTVIWGRFYVQGLLY